MSILLVATPSVLLVVCLEVNVGESPTFITRGILLPGDVLRGFVKFVTWY